MESDVQPKETDTVKKTGHPQKRTCMNLVYLFKIKIRLLYKSG